MPLQIGTGSTEGRNEFNKRTHSDNEVPNGPGKVSRTAIESDIVTPLKDKLSTAKGSLDLLLSNPKAKITNESLVKIVTTIYESFASVVDSVDHLSKDIAELKGNMGGVKVNLEENRNRVNETRLESLKNKMSKELKETDISVKIIDLEVNVGPDDPKITSDTIRDGLVQGGTLTKNALRSTRIVPLFGRKKSENDPPPHL